MQKQVSEKKRKGMCGVAFVEAETRAEASHFFQQQYAGEFHTIERIERLTAK